MSRLVIDLLRPYRGWLAIVFAAMLVEIAASLAAPWPLKLVIDDALGAHHLPRWLEWAHEYAGFGKHTLGVALFAGVATVAIATIGAVASYVDNYYTTSMGQWIANDLRLRIYEHLHRQRPVTTGDSAGYHELQCDTVIRLWNVLAEYVQDLVDEVACVTGRVGFVERVAVGAGVPPAGADPPSGDGSDGLAAVTAAGLVDLHWSRLLVRLRSDFRLVLGFVAA